MINTDSLEDVLAADDEPDPMQEDASDPPDGLSGVCGPGSRVEQCPVPIAL